MFELSSDDTLRVLAVKLLSDITDREPSLNPVLQRCVVMAVNESMSQVTKTTVVMPEEVTAPPQKPKCSGDWRYCLGVSSDKASLANFLGLVVMSQSYDFIGARAHRGRPANMPKMDLSSLRRED